MASENESMENTKQPFLSLYSNYLRNRIHAFSVSQFFSKFTLPFRSTQRPHSFPLPLPSNSLDSSLVVSKPSSVHCVLQDILQHVFADLHSIQKNLHFWHFRAEGSDARKAYFMVFERGPRAFIDETAKFLLPGGPAEGYSMKNLYQSASDYINERVTVLNCLRCSLATFLAQLYMEIDKIGADLVTDPESKLPSLLVTINELFSALEASIGHLHAIRQSDSSVDGSYSIPLLFEKLPEINQEGSQWTDCEIKDAISSVYQNLNKLDSYISVLVTKHKKPRKITQYWIRYTCGAVGLSACSVWLLRHSSLTGSSDLDNWVQEAKDSTVGFFKDHVEQPLLSIRDELFETFRKRHQGIMDHEEVQLTSESLHRMLLAFSEQTKGQKLPENASDHEMLEIVMDRYEKELAHPIQNLLSGELARALLIQVQKLKLDTETAMLELNQILRANEINFAILAALPAFFLSLLLMMFVRAWFKQDTKAEGRGRIARIQRRLLVVEVEKRVMQYQDYIEQGLEKDAQCMFGLVLYSLDRLYHSVKRHAEASGEWQCLRQDIIDLARPGLQTAYKLTVTSRMERVYDCLLPSLKRR
ncbi:putative nuclear control of ATP synthase 2 [Lupinus albus]|uniref:Putative nuclear control of ATP synthase 2 n=1 Tax=Lupinus albus TaxID=3870 RepID=A0A6A4PYA5_LUPAL|nr:putative nuclear control of ATP synthase 2 [Lupinus albus]